MQLDGIHHVSATVRDGQETLDFYAGVLGLRLVVATVNQDAPSMYHLFLADERGSAGADLTFFEIKGARPGRAGAGTVHTIRLRVADRAALDFWDARLTEHSGVVGSPMAVEPRGEDADVLAFVAPDGLRYELVVDTSGDPPLPATGAGVPAEHAILGFDGVRTYSHDHEKTVDVLENLLGATRRADGAWELRGPERGGVVIVDPGGGPTIQGAGVVHHVAFATTMLDQDGWLRRLEEGGLRTSGHVDRHYFQSIYAREPGGVLYELATHEPGFAEVIGEERFGAHLELPPMLEPHREAIAAGLTPLRDPAPRTAA